jgi:hypothetical protein
MVMKLKFNVNAGTNSADIKVSKASATEGVVELTVDSGYFVALKSDGNVIQGTGSFNPNPGTPLQLSNITKV